MRSIFRSVVLIACFLLLRAGEALAETELRSGRFTNPAFADIPELKDLFVYEVECEDASHCTAQLDQGHGDVFRAPLVYSAKLRREVEATLAQIKLDRYPSSHDEMYLPLDGQRATDCWSAAVKDNYREVGGLCRFEAKGGAETWIVLWGDPCSTHCFSGFVPMYMKPDWAIERRWR